MSGLIHFWKRGDRVILKELKNDGDAMARLLAFLQQPLNKD
jgi:hypothetical protein